MPLRCAASPLAVSVSVARPRRQYLLHGITPFFLLSAETSPPKQSICGFHSFGRLRDEQIDRSMNHYETLKLQPGATPTEIKKSFYALSKTHHPDHNPSNPHASRRFMRISEAYSILSIPAKRASYDRDTLQLHKRAQHAQQQTQYKHPSYSSTNNPAGGRPASGLSRRRSAFQGPPPSFYRSGGWGAHGAKRRAAHEGSTANSSSSSSTSSTSSTSSSSSSQQASSSSSSASQDGTASGPASGAGGMGPGQTPFGRGYESDVPHFDRESHERAARWSDRRRARRRAYVNEHEINLDKRPLSEDRGEGAMFVVVGGILVMSIIIPLVLGSIWNGSAGDKERNRRGKWSAAA
ncbi:DnaJ-domain-containing protein [Annulohypoxylon truncatum]|uniref:DnaJ-domain-containing protein n=1 Tax=Annulohypoxylon truncatum TaxID=327061 RepID=UPI002007F73D|nr:DnaJ-domain-containing protein [Annulohypoxylon truncatum]KAI1211508.1 DnaJ-domain-containing protein [Annulohypoxylon truncatum]